MTTSYLAAYTTPALLESNWFVHDSVCGGVSA